MTRLKFARSACFACAAALLTALAAPAFALDSANDAPAAMRLASDERAFLNDAATAGMLEIEASRLAATKSASPNIKRFAGELVKERSALNAQLKALAAEKSFSLRGDMTKKQTTKLEMLKRKNGADFDSAYVKTIAIDAHKGEVKAFKSATDTMHDDDVKNWAIKTLPTIERTLAKAESLKP